MLRIDLHVRAMRPGVGLATGLAACLLGHATFARAADDPVFSGPQVGEPLPPLAVRGVFDERQGETFDPLAEAGSRPALIIFVHELTRPGIAVTRALTGYAASLGVDDAYAAVVWLDDDPAKAEAYLNRARASLALPVPVGVSPDGGEGPGAYGLNRNVALTILVARRGRVVDNVALIQPSLSEVPKIAAGIARLVGREPPSADALETFAHPPDASEPRRAMRRGEGR